MGPKIIKRNSCRICKSTDLVKFLSLGSMLHAGSFPTKEQLSSEKSYPLEVYCCVKAEQSLPLPPNITFINPSKIQQL